MFISNVLVFRFNLLAHVEPKIMMNFIRQRNYAYAQSLDSSFLTQKQHIEIW